MSPGKENLGHAPIIQVAIDQHRGIAEYTTEQLKRMYPIIQVGALHADKRAKKPHDFRSNSTSDKYLQDLCNLCGQARRQNHLHFF